MIVGATILADLRRRGVVVKGSGGRLRLEAPAGVLTPDVVARVKRHKSEVLAILCSEPDPARWDPLVPDGWTPGAWHGRLLYMARICTHTGRAQELQEWAQAVAHVHRLDLGTER